MTCGKRQDALVFVRECDSARNGGNERAEGAGKGVCVRGEVEVTRAHVE